jgi:hypothetical protein
VSSVSESDLRSERTGRDPFTPESCRSCRQPALQLWANSRRTHTQQKQRAFRPEYGERRHRPADLGVIFFPHCSGHGPSRDSQWQSRSEDETLYLRSAAR